MLSQVDSPLFTRKQLTRLIWPLLVEQLLSVLVGMVVFRIGFAYGFVMLLGKNVLWIWYAMSIDWLFRVIVFTIAFRKQNPPGPA